MSSRSPANDEFLLHGRTADLVNVAGKRSSFGYLNAQLNAVPGVIDGAFFLREGLSGSTGVDAPGRGRGGAGIDRGRLDRTAAPADRPGFPAAAAVMVDALPRNATGKLPQQALQGFAEQRLRSPRIAMKMHSTSRLPPTTRHSRVISPCFRFCRAPCCSMRRSSHRTGARHRPYSSGALHPRNFSTRCGRATPGLRA